MRSRRVSPIIVTDLDFADDIALFSQEIDAAQQLLQRVEIEAGKVGLHLDRKKTEVQCYNIYRPLCILSQTGDYIKEVDKWGVLVKCTGPQPIWCTYSLLAAISILPTP